MLSFAHNWAVLFCSTQHCWLLVQRMTHTYTTSEITIHNFMARTFHPVQATSQGSFGHWQLWHQSLEDGYTLLAQLSRVGRGWWKLRCEWSATPPAMFRRGLFGALAPLPTLQEWAACRQEGWRQRAGQRAQRLGWMMCEWMLRAPPRQPSSAKHLSPGASSRGWTGLPPACRVGRENEKLVQRITDCSELEREPQASLSPTSRTRSDPDGFASRRQTSSVMGGSPSVCPPNS